LLTLLIYDAQRTSLAMIRKFPKTKK